MAWKKIVLTGPLLTRYRNSKGYEPICHGQNCDKALHEGDEVWTHSSRNGQSYYCLECYEGLWL